MKTMSSTEARNHFSTVIAQVNEESISICKKNKPVAVMMSSRRYDELKRIEDILYGKAAELAIKEGFASKEESEDLLNSI